MVKKHFALVKVFNFTESIQISSKFEFSSKLSIHIMRQCNAHKHMRVKSLLWSELYCQVNSFSCLHWFTLFKYQQVLLSAIVKIMCLKSITSELVRISTFRCNLPILDINAYAQKHVSRISTLPQKVAYNMCWRLWYDKIFGSRCWQAGQRPVKPKQAVGGRYQNIAPCLIYNTHANVETNQQQFRVWWLPGRHIRIYISYVYIYISLNLYILHVPLAIYSVDCVHTHTNWHQRTHKSSVSLSSHEIVEWSL